MAPLAGNQRPGTSVSHVVKVDITSPGALDGPLYLSVDDPQQILSQGTGIGLTRIDASSYAAVLNTSASLAPGKYQGTFPALLCKEPACAGHSVASRVSLPYLVNITDQPLTTFTRMSTRATAHVGAADPPPVDVQIYGPPGGWNASASSSWLQLTPSEGRLPATVRVRFAIQGMTPGLYQDQMVVRSADGQEARVGFTLELLPTQFRVSTEYFYFTGVNGASIPSQTLTFDLNNGVSTNWTASAAAPWLLLTPGSGTTPGLLMARPDASKSSLASGAHATSIVLASAGYPSKTVNAALMLTKPTLSASSTTVTLGGPKGRDEVAQSTSVSLNTGANPWPWTLSAPLITWAAVAPTSGSVDASGAPLSFSPVFSAAAPGTHSGVATVTANVNGDTVTLPLTVVLNRDKRQLLPSEWGIGFASTPAGSVLARTLRVTDNFGAALPWTATSSAPWLSVTSSGTTGTGPDLTLVADPALAAADAISYATVTLKTSSPDVSEATIRVGLWRSSGGLSALTTLPTDYVNAVADTIRPYVYAHNGGSAIDIYNAHLGTKVGTIANAGAALAEMAVAPDGSKLYAVDTSSKTIVVVDLATASKTEAWPLQGSVYSSLSLLAVRTNGKDIVLAGGGEAYADGRRIATLPSFGNVVYAASSDGRRLFSHNRGLSPSGVQAFDLDYSAMGGGTLMAKATAAASFINGSSNGQDIAVNADATALYIASGAPYRCSSVNPVDLAFIASLPGGDPYPNNIKVTRDGRAICGISGWYSSADIWVHAPNGTLLKSFKFAGYAKNLLERQLVVTPDGMTAVGLTNDPRMAFIPLGAP
ncbi:hypothetical protein M2165_002210 [Variovorax sp. TBS-050B]|uniref:BACON domain-containing protein n=1 Tax=Variovorax sp. TBS-050B TaxID=2940551 RepID=UPI0024772D5B|nr:hypothetical protein [Variovorax sp. TBS-050B]MDH6592321.1 hypothetical protein [Variovorax sp. TBS-050B]